MGNMPARVHEYVRKVGRHGVGPDAQGVQNAVDVIDRPGEDRQPFGMAGRDEFHIEIGQSGTHRGNAERTAGFP